ncbi:MAG: hypothetical protein RBR86_02855 [Pseudobdellovibrionaceae bacterium]|jgi:hypothetical protein|nr:hypothetical protein [Pseudobdellovibrionaceae bacterium]
MSVRHQNGSALILILIGVALFAALSYAVVNGLRVNDGASSGVTRERADADMSSVMDFATATANGFQQMVLSDERDPNSIVFTRPSDAGYNTAPHDFKIFHPQGGHVTYQETWSSLDDSSETTATDWHFVRNAIDGIGGAGDEVIMALVRVPERLCARINYRLTGSEAIPSESGDMDGMFALGTSPIDSSNCAACEGKSSMCVANGNVRVFYYVLDRG